MMKAVYSYYRYFAAAAVFCFLFSVPPLESQGALITLNASEDATAKVAGSNPMGGYLRVVNNSSGMTYWSAVKSDLPDVLDQPGVSIQSVVFRTQADAWKQGATTVELLRTPYDALTGGASSSNNDLTTTTSTTFTAGGTSFLASRSWTCASDNYALRDWNVNIGPSGWSGTRITQDMTENTLSVLLRATSGIGEGIHFMSKDKGVSPELVITYTAHVPVPVAVWLLASSLIGFVGFRRFRK